MTLIKLLRLAKLVLIKLLQLIKLVLRLIQVTFLIALQITFIPWGVIIVYYEPLQYLMDGNLKAVLLTAYFGPLALSLLVFITYNLLSILSILPTRLKPVEAFFYRTRKGSLLLCLLSLSWGYLISFFYGTWVLFPLYTLFGESGYIPGRRGVVNPVLREGVSSESRKFWEATLVLAVVAKVALSVWLLCTVIKAAWGVVRPMRRLEEHDVVVVHKRNKAE